MDSSSLHRTSSVLLLACLVLFTQMIHSSVAQTLSFSAFDSLQPNLITVTCAGVPGPYTFTFTSPGGSSESRPPVTQDPATTYTFTVTPNNETTVKCRGSATSESNSITFAAHPVYDPPVIRMLGLTGRVLELECPYQLGIASNLIAPYHHVWLYANNSDVEIPGSGRQRTFSVDVNQDSNALYSCAMNMSRCPYPDCTNVRVLPPFSDRVKFRITKAEPISMVTTPENQRVNSSDSASFNCSARGSSIAIIWQYNGKNYTMANSNSNVTVKNESVPVMNGDVSADNVYSTLMIKSATDNASVNCVVRQIFDGSIDPTFNNENFAKGLPADETVSSAALTVIPPPPTEPPPTTMEPSQSMTTPDPTPTTSTAPSTGGLADDVKIILVCFAIVIVVAASVIISLVIFLYCHYQYKYRRDSSKLGRFLSRAVSKPSTRINRQSSFDYPTDSNGHLDNSLFQPGYPMSHPSAAPQSYTDGTQGQEQVYETSQNSNASGYSGLSGVSNQEPGHHQMPYYAGTDVSGGSANPQASITSVSGGRLAPPSHHSNGNIRSNRSSDCSVHSAHSRQGSNASYPVKLTAEALSQFQKGPQKASSYNHIPSTNQQTRSAHVTGHHYPQLQANSGHYHSDTGYMSYSNPQLTLPPEALKPNIVPSPALATVDATPNNQPDVPFPHRGSPPTNAPFPNEDSNQPPKKVTDETIEKVLDSLMHNRNCAIPNCICFSARQLYKSKVASKRKPASTVQYQSSSSSSDSDSALGKRSRLFLPLSSQDPPALHPHFHPSSKTRVRSSVTRHKLTRKRSKSLDLTPVPEVSPTKAPKVGGCLVAGTPVCGAPPTIEDAIAEEERLSPVKGTLGQNIFSAAPAHRYSPSMPDCLDSNLDRLTSLSADNLPTLCLNDCPLVNTPKEEIKALSQAPVSHTSSAAGKPALSTINERNKEADTDGSNTSSRSDSPPNHTKVPPSNQSSKSSHPNRMVSSSTSSQENSLAWNSLPREVVERESSQGYQSETLSSEASLSMSSLKPTPKRNCSRAGSDHSLRSASPAYETCVTVSDDGSTVQTTEC